ncbi:MAG TPA: hypothetical protein VFN35_03915, partial [Ktedonobacteraceae bacterium]|nr:hypothetical protein [Ktedonobacteraceae bacterium]
MKTIGDSIDTYRIVWKQDEPGSWESYLVENVSEPGSLYCLQVQPRSRFTRQEEYSAFRTQMEALQKVRELYIHRLIGFGADGGGHPYLVYPEVTVGLKSLQSRLQEGPLGEDEAKGILTRVGMALVFAHQQGVVHGFFSPESVLLMGDGDVRVFSFLSSVPDTSLARVSLPRGYRFLDEKASRLSDQYALASLANELLLQPGRLPTNATVLHQAISRAQLSDPARRFATIREFLLQLGIELTLPQSEQEREVPPARPEEKTQFDYAMEALQARGRSDIVSNVEEPTRTTNPPPATKSTGAGTMASTPPQTRTGDASPAAKRPTNRRGCLITLLCILLIPLLIFLHSILPASAATVTIAPVDQQLHQNYQLKEAAATNLAAQQFGGHTLTYKTKTTTKSSHISKKTFVEGTSAQGHLVFSQISDPIYLDLYDLSIDVGNNITLIV